MNRRDCARYVFDAERWASGLLYRTVNQIENAAVFKVAVLAFAHAPNIDRR